MRYAVAALTIGLSWGQTAPSSITLPNAPEASHADSVLASGIADKNPDVRKQAAASLGLIGAREPYLSQVQLMLGDKDVYVRLAAIASLVDLRSAEATSSLSVALTDPAPEVSFAAAKALWTLGDPRGESALLAVLDREAKTSSNFLTSKKRDTLRMFHTPKTIFLFAVKQGIGFAPVPGLGEGVSSLQEILSDNGVSGRATAAILLANDKSPEVLDALTDALGDHDASVRAAALHALALRGDTSVIPMIVPMLADDKQNVRLRAAAAYLRLAWIQYQLEHAPTNKK